MAQVPHLLRERIRGCAAQRAGDCADRGPGWPGTVHAADAAGQRLDGGHVALTLDAGASAEPVPQILATLREHGVKITFFLTGKWIEDNPELTRQIVADGHEIANHSFTHPDMRNLSDEAIRTELGDTEALLAETAGRLPGRCSARRTAPTTSGCCGW